MVGRFHNKMLPDIAAKRYLCARYGNLLSSNTKIKRKSVKYNVGRCM